MRGPRLIVSIAAVLLASGCTGPAPDAIPADVVITPAVPLSATIPLPQDGDRAEYRTENYRALIEVFDSWQGSPALGDVPYPMVTRAYASLDHPPSWPAYREAVDPATNRLLWSVDPCPFNMDGQCKGAYHDGYETWRAEVAGLPWGYGSSIFQGRELSEGIAFEETFPLGLVDVPVRFKVERAWTANNVSFFEVHGALPFSGNATEMIAGTWILSSASPFAVEYRTNLTLASTKPGTYRFGINATLSEFIRGDGPMILDAPLDPWQAPRRDFEDAKPLERGLPVGAQAEIGLDGYTFRGAWNHLLGEDPDLGVAASSPGFRLWSMQVPREEIDGGALVLRDHYVEGSFSYFEGERFESAFVSHDCSTVDVLELTLSCDYSGTGPTDGMPGMRGDVRFDDAIDFRLAHETANASLPRPTRIFVFGTYTNGVEDASARQEAYGFSFFFHLLGEDGEPTTSGFFGHVRIDASTGEVRSRTLENP